MLRAADVLTENGIFIEAGPWNTTAGVHVYCTALRRGAGDSLRSPKFVTALNSITTVSSPWRVVIIPANTPHSLKNVGPWLLTAADFLFSQHQQNAMARAEGKRYLVHPFRRGATRCSARTSRVRGRARAAVAGYLTR